MRIAYIGLSTPISYDYLHYASKASSDTLSSPNPILESPFGLLLLYDEIWFLCRSLYPENMRGLPYIRFLDESGMLPPLKDLEPIFEPFGVGAASEEELDALFIKKRLKRFKATKVPNKLHKIYHAIIEREMKLPMVPAADWQRPIFAEMGIDWTDPDNHTNELRIGNITAYANSASPERLIFDIVMVGRLSIYGGRCLTL